VQHAHQKGVIHRDLKPSNILVAEADGKPLVKVIDFGVAKAIGQPLTDKTLFSCFQVIGTPLYMSPEQAQLGGIDVDTRADVYALGVILYELMTGTTPLDRDRLEQAPSTRCAASFARRARQAQHAPAPGPGGHGDQPQSQQRSGAPAPPAERRARLDRAEVPGEGSHAPLRRRERPGAGRATLPGQGAGGSRAAFGQLPAAQALRSAIAPSVLTAAFVLLVLVGGIVGTTIGLIRADQQRARAVTAELDARVQRDHAVTAAESAEKRLAQIEKGVEILTAVFEDLAPNTLDPEGGCCARCWASGSRVRPRQLQGEAIGDPLVVARLQHKLAGSLISLGYPERVIDLLTQARTTFTRRARAEDRETIGCVRSLANAYRWTGKFELAFRSAPKRCSSRGHLGTDDPDTIECLGVLGLIQASLGRLDRALALFEEELALRKEVDGIESSDTILAMATSPRPT
jgi:hypothetical protein